MSTIEVTVWICPHGHYFGSSSAGDLAEQTNRRSAMRNRHNEPPENWGSVTGTRARCQICAQQGVEADRVPVTVDLEVPAPAAAA